MYIFTYSLVMLTIISGMIYGIRLALRSFSTRNVKHIFCPAYPENEAEYELRRLAWLYPNAVITVPASCLLVRPGSFQRIHIL